MFIFCFQNFEKIETKYFRSKWYIVDILENLPSLIYAYFSYKIFLKQIFSYVDVIKFTRKCRSQFSVIQTLILTGGRLKKTLLYWNWRKIVWRDVVCVLKSNRFIQNVFSAEVSSKHVQFLLCSHFLFQIFLTLTRSFTSCCLSSAWLLILCPYAYWSFGHVNCLLYEIVLQG